MSSPVQSRLLILSVAVLFLAGCPGDSDTPPDTQPPPAPDGETTSTETATLDFARIAAPAGKRWLECDAAVGGRHQKDIGPQGDTIQLGEHLITVPEGAVRERVRFTVVEPSNRYVQLVLTAAPNVRFGEEVGIQVSYRRCSNVEVVDPDMHRATSSSVNRVFNQQHNQVDSTVVGRVTQFSNFALATN